VLLAHVVPSLYASGPRLAHLSCVFRAAPLTPAQATGGCLRAHNLDILARCRDLPSDIAQHQYFVGEIDTLSQVDRAEVEIRSTLDILALR
jgi:hypothetical protein